MKNHWLIKSEPTEYSWKTFQTEGQTLWTGVRNHQAAANLRRMKVGDDVLFYHSVTEKAVVGIAKVIAEATPDPTAPEGTNWVAPTLAPMQELKKPVTLAALKADPSPLIQNLPLLKQARLSVMPIEPTQWEYILTLAQTA